MAVFVAINGQASQQNGRNAVRLAVRKGSRQDSTREDVSAKRVVADHVIVEPMENESPRDSLDLRPPGNLLQP